MATRRTHVTLSRPLDNTGASLQTFGNRSRKSLGTAASGAKRSFDKTAMFAKPQYQELHNERRGHGTRPHHLNEFAERHHRLQPTFVTKSANNRISSAYVRKVTGSGTTALCDEVLLPTVAPELTTAFAHASGRAARVSFNISFENRSSSTRRASTIAPTMADHAAIAERRFPSGVSPSASAAR
jgi:hypothetical protein